MLISIEALSKTYLAGEVEIPAVQGITLEIARGESVALVGPSGSGKSTLLNLLGCLDRPTTGSYRLDGVDVSRLDADGLADIRNHKIGFVFQGFNLLKRTSALENVEIPLLYAGPLLSKRQKRLRAWRALETVGLADRARHHPHQLSGGQQQRVAIARAIVNEPALLLADEPTGNLDTTTGAEVMEVFRSLNRAGLTLILVTHDPEIARQCARQVVVRDGRIVSDSSSAAPSATVPRVDPGPAR